MSRRVLMGQWPAGVGSGFGLRVSLPGRDATSLDDRDLIFSSDWSAILPVHQAGTFTVTNGTQASIDFPDLGYVPFAYFLLRPNGAPFGSAAYTPQFQSGWQAYQGVPYLSKSGGSALRLRAHSGAVLADYTLYQPGGNSLGWPSSFDIAYMVYRLRANA